MNTLSDINMHDRNVFVRCLNTLRYRPYGVLYYPYGVLYYHSEMC